MAFTLEQISSIYDKLNCYRSDYFDIAPDAINFYLALKFPVNEIKECLQLSRDYQQRKTLYLASDRVVDLTVGGELQMTGENIFRYQDMKMVVRRMT